MVQILSYVLYESQITFDPVIQEVISVQTNVSTNLQEQEARIDILRTKAQNKYGSSEMKKEEKVKEEGENGKSEHVNFFKDLEEGWVILFAILKLFSVLWIHLWIFH